LKSKLINPSILTLMWLGVAGLARAQVYTGSLSGRVVDQTNAVLPGVTVTLGSERLLQQQTAVSSSTGAYRFAELPVGAYTVRFELVGFKTVVREGLRVSAGADVQVNVGMALSQVAETVTVSADSPVVDMKKTGIPESFGRDRLENIPTARDPWVILEQTPGMVMDRENVGGNESGQQSNFVTRGTRFDQNTWNYDGVNITDFAASGATPMYFDFGAFEEINIQTGGQDPSMQSAGTQINFIIKQGTNGLKGQGAFYGTDESLQGTNIDDALRAEGAGAGAPIKYILDYGFDVGGPIVKDRAWIWGDYGVQDIHRGSVGFLKPGCTDPEDANCLNDDPTKLSNANLKFNLQITPSNKFNFLLAWNDKTRETRGASDLRPLETTWKQSGPVYIYKFEDTHIVNSNLLFTGRFAYVDGGFQLDYQEPGLRNVQTTLDLATGAFGGSFLDFRTERPQYVGNFDGNYFLSDALGGDHEFKFGFQYKKTPIDSFTTYGGDVWAVTDGGEAAEAWFFRPSARLYDGSYAAVHVQDTYTKGRMNLKLGARYDYQTGKNKASPIPANMVLSDLMPAIDFPGTPSIDAWQSLSPRLGFTYDLTGDGKTMARASYSRYYDVLILYDVVKFNNGADVSTLYLPWTDLNGDRNVQGNEVDRSTILYLRNLDPDNPTSVASPNVVDPGLSPPITDEVIVGFEREIIPDFSVGAHYIYKRFTNMIWDEWPHGADGLNGLEFPFVGASSTDFVPVTTSFEGQTVTYFELPFLRDPGNFLANRPDYRQRYQGVEISGHKRLSNRWMFNFGFTVSDHREFFDGDGGVLDPTNIGLRDEGQVAFFSDGSGKQRFFLNSRWNVKLDGMVQLPGGVNLAGKLNGRQGYPFIRTFRTPSRAGGLGRIEALLEPVGESRLDSLWIADFRVEKSFDIGGRRLSGMVDIFNLLNSSTVLKREQRQNLTTANRIQDILSPRVVRFGVRVNF
jgi:hypothetical protein